MSYPIHKSSSLNTSKRSNQNLTVWLVLSMLAFVFTAPAQQDQPVRTLRVAIYPLVPQRAEMIAQIKQAFAVDHPEIQLQFTDLTAEYYAGPLMQSLNPDSANDFSADVVEVDTVFLRDLVKAGWIAPLPVRALGVEKDFLPAATAAVKLDGKLYGVPHWVCSNFLFFRKDDPDAKKLAGVTNLKGLEEILQYPAAEANGVVVDVDGKTTVGELYAGALFDEYKDVGQVVSHLNSAILDPAADQAIRRLYGLCPGGLNHDDAHHATEDFYAREFGGRKARGLIGYSELLFFVEDEMLHGTAQATPPNGESFDAGVLTIAAPLSDDPTRILGYVDAMAMRAGLNEQKQKDAMAFIEMYTSFDLNRGLLIPAKGQAPRYLLPARIKLYEDEQLRKSAPLYERFEEIMKGAEAIDAPDLVDTMRARGKSLNAEIASGVANH